MKRLLFLMLAGFVSLTLSAQEPTTTWPYLYPDFTDGVIYMRGGQKIPQKVNVHLAKGRIHYIDDKGVVRELNTQQVLFTEIGSDQYMVVNGDVMKVVGNVEKGFVAIHTYIDFQRMNETGGAYGTSSTSSATKKLTSVETAGANVNHMELAQNRENGEEVFLKTNYYIVTGGKVYEASKKGIESQLPADKAAAYKSFLKEHKIAWKDPQSLLQLVDFLSE